MQAKSVIKSLIVIQLIIISFLTFQLHNKKTKFYTQTSVSLVSKNTIQQAKTNELKYYYDLKTNGIATWSASFLKEPTTNIHNNDGLNDVQNYPINKKNGTFRIITLGDSFTYGQFVDTKNNWTEILENKLNSKKICKNIDKFEVINFGVPGFDPTYEVEQYRQKGIKYNPDLIIWMLIDYARFCDTSIPIVSNYAKDTNTNFEDSWEIIRNNYIKNHDRSEIENDQRKNILKIRNFYQGHIFFIDYYNTHQKIINNITNTDYFNELATKKYLYKKFPQKKSRFPDSHPNELGHKLIADILYEQLLKTNQINCQSL